MTPGEFPGVFSLPFAGSHLLPHHRFMPTLSVIAASIARYRSLTPPALSTGTALPPIFFDDAPVTDGSGNQIYPPYVVLKDNGLTPTFDMAFRSYEETPIEFEVHADLLADVDLIVEAMKYNGAAIYAQQGFDFGTLPDLAVNWDNIRLVRTFERRYQAGRGKLAQVSHACDLKYKITNVRLS